MTAEISATEVSATGDGLIGRTRPAVDSLPAYRPGKAASQAEAEHGITNAIKLASNENPLPPIASIVEAVTKAAMGANRYADHRASAVRERLSGALGVDVAGITIGCGSVGLLQQIALTYIDPGDEVIYPWRSFEVYPVYTQLMGGVAVPTPLTAEHAFDLDAVVAAVTERTKLILLSTPNNPTGTALTCGQLNDLIAHIPESVIVVIDEAYREFLDPSFGDPVHEVLPHHRNVIVTRTFSKAHGLAGIRAGYAVADPTIIGAIDKTLFPFAVNGLAQAAAIAAIDATDEIQARVDMIVAERARVIAYLARDGWELPDQQANFVYLPLGDRTDAIYLAMEMRGVVTRPFSGEGIRVTIGSVEENDRFLATLTTVMAG